MRPCCVPNCDDKSAPRHAFPRKDRVRFIWLERVKNPKLKNDINFLKSYAVCEKHFHHTSLERVGNLKSYAVPVLHLPENCFSYSPIFKQKRTPDKIRLALNTPTSALEDVQHLKVKTPEKTYQRSLKRKVDYSLTFEDIATTDPVASSSTFNISEISIPDHESEADPKLPMPVSTKKKKTRRLQHSLKVLKTIDRQSKRMTSTKKMKMIQKNQHLLKYLRGINDTTLKFFQSQLQNQGVKPQGRRYTTDDKAFSLCLFKQSGKAYRFLSNVFSLPSTRLLTKTLNKIPFLAGINDVIFNHQMCLIICLLKKKSMKGVS